jgi:hypothetical protein
MRDGRIAAEDHATDGSLADLQALARSELGRALQSNQLPEWLQPAEGEALRQLLARIAG